MIPFAWSILMALNIAFSNIWGMILGEWKGSKQTTIIVLVIGIVILIASTFVVNFGN
jgi:L-rhamnose-H+ transport protein